MLLGEVTELELAHVVSRVRAAVNRCEHEPSYTSDDTITKKLLAVLAKDGRHTPEFFANFNAYAFVIGTLCADGAAHAAASSTDSGRVAAPGTPDPPAATAAPKIASFRTPKKAEGQAQAEYAEAAGRFHSKRRAGERAEESRNERKLEAMLAQIYEARVAQELREARYNSEMHEFVAENVARRHGPDAAWCTQPPPPLHPHRCTQPTPPPAPSPTRPCAQSNNVSTPCAWQAAASHLHVRVPQSVPSVRGGSSTAGTGIS